MYKYTIIAGVEFTSSRSRVQDRAKKEALEVARYALALEFGGYTETSTKGGWFEGSGDLIQEDGVKFEAYSSEQKHEAMHSICRTLAKNLEQESVLAACETTSFTFIKGV